MRILQWSTALRFCSQKPNSLSPELQSLMNHCCLWNARFGGSLGSLFHLHYYEGSSMLYLLYNRCIHSEWITQSWSKRLLHWSRILCSVRWKEEIDLEMNNNIIEYGFENNMEKIHTCKWKYMHSKLRSCSWQKHMSFLLPLSLTCSKQPYLRTSLVNLCLVFRFRTW